MTGMVSILGIEREHIVAFLDVRRGSASVALVSVSRKHPARVRAIGRSTLSLESRTGVEAIAAIKTQVEEAAAAAVRGYSADSGLPTIHAVYAVLHAPLANSEIVRVRADRDADTAITESEIARMAKDSVSASTSIDVKRLLEAAIHSIRLNGYPLSKPEGKYAATIELASILSDADPASRRATAEAIAKVFPIAKIHWRSGMRSLLTVLQKSQPSLDEYLVVDMGLEATHLISVREGQAIEQRVIPEGVRTILDRIAPGKPPEETMGYLRMLGRDACEGTACETMQASIVQAEPELARIIGEALGSMAAVRRVPNQLIVLADGDLLPWLTRFLTRIDFAQFTTTMLPFTVRTPEPLDLAAYVVPDHIVDTSSAFGAALVNIEENS